MQRSVVCREACLISLIHRYDVWKAFSYKICHKVVSTTRKILSLSLSFSLLTCLYLSWILIQLIFFLSGDLCIVLLSCDTETFFLYFYFQTSLLICIREISLRVGSRGLFGNSMYICANLDVRENYQWSLLSIVFIFLV